MDAPIKEIMPRIVVRKAEEKSPIHERSKDLAHPHVFSAQLLFDTEVHTHTHRRTYPPSHRNTPSMHIHLPAQQCKRAAPAGVYSWSSTVACAS